MGEEDKFQYIDRWLGPRLNDYNSCLANLEEACQTADNSASRPLFERIHAIDIAQRNWRPYVLQAGWLISAIGEYLEKAEPLGKEASRLVDAAREKMELISSERSGLALKVAQLSGLRAELTEQYLKEEGLLE